MPKLTKAVLEPRKTPVQSRSAASVEAIREATVQVLLSEGKEGLTTRKVADRAGVSVGTLYQYFPNKRSLLQWVLREHLDRVATTVLAACEEHRGRSLEEMGAALVEEFLRVKVQSVEMSRALYFVGDDVGGAEIARRNATRNVAAVAGMLESAKQRLREDPKVVATTMLAAMAGVSRRMLEGRGSKDEIAAIGRELRVMMRAYLQTCTAAD